MDRKGCFEGRVEKFADTDISERFVGTLYGHFAKLDIVGRWVMANKRRRGGQRGSSLLNKK